jgi:hypothetical protein
MAAKWEEMLTDLSECPRCRKRLGNADPRVLSVYDDTPVCLDCKKQEEGRPDYAEVSKRMIGQCLADVELQQGDPGGYCFHHFYAYQPK